MARQPSSSLTDGELRLMKVLWARGESSVLDIRNALHESLQDSTIRTILGILSRKGHVSRRKEGRAFLYKSRRPQQRARLQMVRQIVRRLFQGPSELLLEILDSEDLSEEELNKIKAAIREKERAR